MKFICVSGYFASGSSAVVDYLKGFQNNVECDAEIRFIRDPYGLQELENSLVKNWDMTSSSFSIRMFLKMCKIWNRNGTSPFSRPGLTYSKKINKDFVKISNDYINSLVKGTYKADFYCDSFQKNYFKYVSDRIRRYLQYKHGIKIANHHVALDYISRPTEDFFLSQTKKYINKLFSNYSDVTKDSGYVILDQAISPSSPENTLRYFDEAKLIIVDRDPRDIFVDNIKWCDILFKNPNSIEAAKTFVELYKALHKKTDFDNYVLKIQFEDLVLNFSEASKKIDQFIGSTNKNIKKQKQYFDPKVSNKNVYMWKKYYSKYHIALDFIEKELKEYLYEK